LAITKIYDAKNSKRIYIEEKYHLPSKKSQQNAFLWSNVAILNTFLCQSQANLVMAVLFYHSSGVDGVPKLQRRC